MIVSLYAGGMTIRDIRHHLASTIDSDLSHETISKITGEIVDEVLAWQTRPLEALYPVIYLDALVVKVRGGAHVKNKATHLALGVDVEGVKQVLGIWIQATEGAKFWGGVCAELANRGVKDVLIVCCDGLAGLSEAVAAAWPMATVQTCVVHLIKAAKRFVTYGDRKRVAAALKPISRPSTPKPPWRSWKRSRRASWAVSTRLPRKSSGMPGNASRPSSPSRLSLGRSLHHQHHRIAELPAAQDHQEPRALPQ